MKVKILCTSIMILIVLAALIQPVSAAIQAKLIPPNPYTVYTNQTYSLSVGVQYNIPSDVDKLYGPYYFWIESPPYQSGGSVLHGSGIVAFSLTMKAPSTPGTYTLVLRLYVQAKGQNPAQMDTASLYYRVIEPVVTDWDVEKVWIEPVSPGEGDQVTFHATIALKSTTSSEPLSVDVGSYLDKKFYSGASLTFKPQPQKQDVTISKPWTATKGLHSLVFVVDPNGSHNDPTPYPQYNFKEYRFTIEPYYAIVKAIRTPSEIQEGEWFDVVITVEYRFPGSANLKVTHSNNMTLPPVHDETSDTVTGSGTKDYTFRARASYSRVPNATWILTGFGSVMFDRGAGWQITDPGHEKSYTITVQRLHYYALFDSVDAEYLGTGAGGNASIGRVSITLQIRYLLPLESGLRIIVTRSGPNASSMEIWRDEGALTQEESIERTTTYTYEYAFPLSSAKSGSMSFHATVEYLAYGAWNHGDEGSASVTVPYRQPPSSISDYFTAALQRIADWFRRLFGLILQITA